MPRKRSFLESPHHYCGNCGIEGLLSEMVWQEGVLKHTTCADTRLIGDRDLAVAKALSQPSEEGMPDRKLRQPVAANEIQFS